MRYRIAPLFCRRWTLLGISPHLIESHYENNYGAALNRLNAVTAELEALDVETTTPQVISRLSQEQSTLLNATLLHEVYFASLGGDGRTPPEIIATAIARDFASVKRWRREFVALAEGLAGDSGWILLTYIPRDGRLMNQSTSNHGIVGGIPILALDMYEHTYHLEFGVNATAYVAAFMRNIDWHAVEGRYTDALTVPPPRRLEQPQFRDVPSITPEEVQDMLNTGQRVQIIDTRPRHSSTRSHDIVEGAVWRDPDRVEDWMDSLSKDEPVVTFCVYGLPRRVYQRGSTAKGRLRRALYVGWALRMEGHQGPGEALRVTRRTLRPLSLSWGTRSCAA